MGERSIRYAPDEGADLVDVCPLCQGTALEPILHGGGQESGLRAGTENVAAIVGLGAAAVLAAKSLDNSQRRLESLRDQLLEAQMKLELGEISKEEFAETERDILAAIREIKRPQQDAFTLSPKDKVTGVDIDTYESRK